MITPLTTFITFIPAVLASIHASSGPAAVDLGDPTPWRAKVRGASQSGRRRHSVAPLTLQIEAPVGEPVPPPPDRSWKRQNPSNAMTRRNIIRPRDSLDQLEVKPRRGGLAIPLDSVSEVHGIPTLNHEEVLMLQSFVKHWVAVTVKPALVDPKSTAFRLFSAAFLSRISWTPDDLTEKDESSGRAVSIALFQKLSNSCLDGNESACDEIRDLLKGTELAKVLFMGFGLGQLKDSEKLLAKIEPRGGGLPALSSAIIKRVARGLVPEIMESVSSIPDDSTHPISDAIRYLVGE